MTIYLIRHAKAGDRDTWRDDDRLRPLSGRGHRQARLLIDLLQDATFDRVLSSPFVRCMETVVPIAGERGCPVEPVEALAEAHASTRRSRSCASTPTPGALMCTHGDVMPMLLDHYAAAGVDIAARRDSGRRAARGRSTPTAPAKSCRRGTSPPPTA